MIFLDRRRLLIWLIKAYFRKWKKTILLFFGLGLIFFFLLYFAFTRFSPALPFTQTRTVGILGIYNLSNLPAQVMNNLSLGLTSIDEKGLLHPSAASNWKIEGDGKIYTFHLKDNLRFADGSKFTSKEISYNFENVKIERPDKNTIIFKLSESYSPFLVTVSRPIVKNGNSKLTGLGNFRVTSVKLNGEFVESIELQNIHPPRNKISYQFYPTEDSLKTALILGEISETHDLSDLSFKNSLFNKFANYKVEKMVNYNKLATLFYNTQDKVLSDKRLRQALSYAIPNSFEQGKRNFTPYPFIFWTDRSYTFSLQEDLEHSKLLLAQSSASSSSSFKLNIKTLPKYKNSAIKISESWKKIGIKSEIETVNSLPSSFQIFLGEFSVSKDPDQYTLWHSGQSNNITNYKSLRIDKLLEDGRQTVDFEKRDKIYADFQKYLLDDSPATFLFLPYNYTVGKK